MEPDSLARALFRDITRALPAVASSGAEIDRRHYARDLWPRHHLATRSGENAPGAPALVVWPKTPHEVADVVRFAAKRGTPIVPFGAGSGVCGGVLPSGDAIVLDLKRLAAVRSLDVARGELVVEAGAMGITLEEELERRGATLGHFPSSILCSTVGGWVATRSAGQASGYYGKIEDMVVALEAVTGTGELVHLKRRRVGPDLSALVVGSEGALAIVTASRLRVHPVPRERAFASFSFRDVATGLEAMRRMYQAGLRPAVCRLYDPYDASLARSGRVKKRAHGPHDAPWWKEVAMRAAIARSGALNALVHGSLAGRALGGALLVVIFDHHEAGIANELLADARRLVAPLATRDEGEGPARRWMKHRYAVSFRQSPALRSGLFIDTFEVAAPWSRLEAVYDGVRHALGPYVFVMAHFSHAYPDGCCIYFTFAGSTSGHAFERESRARYDRAWREGMSAAVASGATVAHHHGVGRSKAAGLVREIEGGLEAMRTLKRAFDPQSILNPGVLAPIEDVEVPRVSPPTFEGALDERSQLVFADGARTIASVASELSARGLALRGDVATNSTQRVDEWLAEGATGSPDVFADPVDHVAAGVHVALPHGRVIVPPVPRRATGPDWGALAIGARGAFGARVAGAWLRVTARDARGARGSVHPRFEWDDASALGEDERKIVEGVARSLRNE